MISVVPYNLGHSRIVWNFGVLYPLLNTNKNSALCVSVFCFKILQRKEALKEKEEKDHCKLIAGWFSGLETPADRYGTRSTKS